MSAHNDADGWGEEPFRTDRPDDQPPSRLDRGDPEEPTEEEIAYYEELFAMARAEATHSDPVRMKLLAEVGRVVAIASQVDDHFVWLLAEMLSIPLPAARAFARDLSAAQRRQAVLNVAHELTRGEWLSGVPGRIEDRFKDLKDIVRRAEALGARRNYFAHAVYGRSMDNGVETIRPSRKSTPDALLTAEIIGLEELRKEVEHFIQIADDIEELAIFIAGRVDPF